MIKNDMDYWFIYVNVMIDVCIYTWIIFIIPDRKY